MATQTMPGFPFCAFRFLSQWEEKERDLHKTISKSPKNEDICAALAYFQVSRSFTGLSSKNPESAEPLLKLLSEVRGEPSLQSPCDKVIALAKEFESKFGSFNLSAASKLLWLSERNPYIIYDKRAVKALSRTFGFKFNVKNYSDYSRVWRDAYSGRERAIQEAIPQLRGAKKLLRRCCFTDEELLGLASKAWFKERVFDIFLWELGA